MKQKKLWTNVPTTIMDEDLKKRRKEKRETRMMNE